jgi:hypothetical protein
MMMMTTLTGDRVATRGMLFATPCFTSLEVDFTTLSEDELRRRIDKFEHEFSTACPRDFARSVAAGLARKPNADPETRLEVVLREFSKPVVQEVAVRLSREWNKFPATVATLCVCGKDIRLEADRAIDRARFELSRRTCTTATVLD